MLDKLLGFKSPHGHLLGRLICLMEFTEKYMNTWSHGITHFQANATNRASYSRHLFGALLSKAIIATLMRACCDVPVGYRGTSWFNVNDPTFVSHECRLQYLRECQNICYHADHDDEQRKRWSPSQFFSRSPRAGASGENASDRPQAFKRVSMYVSGVSVGRKFFSFAFWTSRCPWLQGMSVKSFAQIFEDLTA